MKKLFEVFSAVTLCSLLKVDLDRFFNKCVFELCFKNLAFKKNIFVHKTKENTLGLVCRSIVGATTSCSSSKDL